MSGSLVAWKPTTSLGNCNPQESLEKAPATRTKVIYTRKPLLDKGLQSSTFALFKSLRFAGGALVLPNLDQCKVTAYTYVERSEIQVPAKKSRSKGETTSASIQPAATKDEGYDGLGDDLNLLELGSKPTLDEVGSAFRSKSLDCHPDRGGDGETFKQLGSARDRLVAWLS